MNFSIIKEKIKSILIWSQKYTKTDMVYLGSQGFWLFLNQAITILAGFVTTLAFANFLKPETLGTYKYLLSFTGILATVTLTGMNTSVIRSTSQGYDGTIIKVIKEKIKWGIAGTMAGCGISLYYYLNENITLSLGLLIISIALPLLYPFEIYSSFLQGKKQFKSFSLFSSFGKIVFSTALIITILTSKNVLVILSVYLTVYILLNILFFLLTIKKHKLNDKTDNETIPYGRHLSMMNLFSMIASNIDKIFLFHFLGAKDVAIYTMAIMPVSYIKDGIRLVSSLALPKLSEKKENYKFKIRGKLYILSLFIAPIIILYIIISPFVFKIFFPLYTEAIIYTQVFSIMLLATPRVLIDTALTAFKKTKQLYITKIISPVLTIIFMITLIPLYGIWGAIIAFLLSQITNYIILSIVYKNL